PLHDSSAFPFTPLGYSLGIPNLAAEVHPRLFRSTWCGPISRKLPNPRRFYRHRATPTPKRDALGACGAHRDEPQVGRQVLAPQEQPMGDGNRRALQPGLPFFRAACRVLDPHVLEGRRTVVRRGGGRDRRFALSSLALSFGEHWRY